MIDEPLFQKADQLITEKDFPGHLRVLLENRGKIRISHLLGWNPEGPEFNSAVFHAGLAKNGLEWAREGGGIRVTNINLAPDKVRELPLNEVIHNTRAFNTLKRSGFETVGDLIDENYGYEPKESSSRGSNTNIRSLRNLGAAGIKYIEAALGQYGFKYEEGKFVHNTENSNTIEDISKETNHPASILSPLERENNRRAIRIEKALERENNRRAMRIAKATQHLIALDTQEEFLQAVKDAVQQKGFAVTLQTDVPNVSATPWTSKIKAGQLASKSNTIE